MWEFVLLAIILVAVCAIWVTWPKPVSGIIGTLRNRNWHWIEAGIKHPVVFDLADNQAQVQYFDTLGGYLQGVVAFRGTYSILDPNTIEIMPTELISSATRRWPDSRWLLTLENNQLRLVTRDAIRDLHPGF